MDSINNLLEDLKKLIRHTIIYKFYVYFTMKRDLNEYAKFIEIFYKCGYLYKWQHDKLLELSREIGVKCVDCRYLKDNPDFDYMKNDRVDICYCDIESDFYPGDISALLGDSVQCEDFDLKTGGI